MMPKLIALARRRTSPGMSLIGTPNISDAVHGVNVEPVAKRLLQHGYIGDLRQQPQFDLRNNPPTPACGRASR